MIKNIYRSTLVLSLLITGIGSSLAATSAPPLVDVDWVKANSCKPGVVVLDIRNKLDGHSNIDYLRGHIPCAVYSDYLKASWRSKVDNVVGQLSPVPKLEKLIGDLGIGNNTHVVIYSAGVNALDMGSDTRVFWTFKVLGHDNVSILNGGFAAYTAVKGNPVQKGNNKPKPVKFTAHLRKDMLISKADVLKAMKDKELLVDNRPHDQFIGVNRHPKATRNGTIPGAVNLPESWLTENNGGKFRSVAEIKKLYAAAGVPTSGKQINFCNTGHWASLGWFVTSQMLGDKQAKVYDGSMVEWTADKSMPMEDKIKLQ
jgi:thiosulfate/3-mercaptopyruvate sulfurtransferase